MIAIGLGLGLPASEILRLYEKQGPAIFDQGHGPVEDWCVSASAGCAISSARNIRPHPSGSACGHSRPTPTRRKPHAPPIPAWHPMLERVYIYKTAHHPRLETDYKVLALDAAMATAAAPTFLKPHVTRESIDSSTGAFGRTIPSAPRPSKPLDC